MRWAAKMVKPSEQISDEELLRRMLAGDAEGFSALYDRRQGGVYKFALRMTGSPELAEDVTQDVFVALMRDGHLFDPTRGTVAGYLFGMTRHRVLRRLERERRFVALEEENEDERPMRAVAVSFDDPLLGLARDEMAEQVRQAVLLLPPHYREVVVLCHLHEMSYEQAAAVIGCPIGTVRSRLNRARGLLLDKLQNWGGVATARATSLSA